VGVLLQGAGYAVLWAFARFRGEVDWWRAVPGILFGLLAVALVWQAIPALGKQWRVQAGLNQDHQLIRTGPYAIVRHPIYASMLGMFLMTGLLLTPWLPLLAALLVFLLGTEIRVRIEDQLLAGRFGAEFEEYRRRVSAYLPGVR
jgi:protein-S-isoprenylcysteine O-methyltransferase Ste14